MPTEWATGYAYLNGQLAAEYTAGTTYFITKDLLGSTRIVSGLGPATVDSLDYYPFGAQIVGDTATTHKFTGYERDTETSLDHAAFRQYSYSQNRWISPDPAGLAAVDPTNPQSLNRYTYVQNNPLNYTDPSGEVIFAPRFGPMPWCDPDDVICDPCEEDPLQCGESGPGGGGGGGGGGVPSGPVSIPEAPTNVGSPVDTGIGSTGAIWSEQVPISGGPINPYLIIQNLQTDITLYGPLQSIGTITFWVYAPFLPGGNTSDLAGPYPNPAIAQSMLKGIVYQLRYAVVQKVCGQNEGTRVLRSMRNGAIIGATKGAYTGFVSGEIFGGEVTFGTSGLGGAALGGFVGGTVGAMKGVFIGTAAALVCKAEGAYN